MKQINIISLLNAFNDLDKNTFESYLVYHSIKIKNDELKDLQVFVENLEKLPTEISLFDKYFIGYTIPQIGKEFDLLRIGENTIVNIELKSQSTKEKILKQLLRNKYYLSFLNKDTYCYTYVSNEETLYFLNDKETLEEVELKKLLQVLALQNVKRIDTIDNYFNPSNYLISPFNSTQEFIKKRYFLTKQQEEIRSNVLKLLDSPEYSIISIKGSAGTGKTLLTYDIAHEVLSKEKKVLIIHCGYLNKGQIQLINNHGWNIIPAKHTKQQNLSQYYLIIVDEVQRIYPSQLDYLLKGVKECSGNILFSYDSQQTLRKWEEDNNTTEKIETNTTVNPYELTTKIRTNKEVASFIKCLFDKKRILEKYTYNNIEINYFDSNFKANLFQEYLRMDNWKIINYTPSKGEKLPYVEHNVINESDNSHMVIGQEFDNVIAVVDEYFYYKDDGKLSIKGYEPYYEPTKMLWQIVSRTRIKLNIVIIKNQEILKRCLEIVN